MVPRPGSTTSNDGPSIQEASEAGARSAGRSPTAGEHGERPVASWSSEGTFTTGHGASDDQEGYEEQFAVPDAAPDEGAAKGRDASRGPTGRKPAKADDQQQPTAKATTKRKPSKEKKKKKLRAPDSADESMSKPQGKDAGRQYTVEEVRYVVAHTELFRLLEQDPILVFLKPMLVSDFTGPFVAPDFDRLTSVAYAAPALFQMLLDSGFRLRAFEMERLCDWGLESWLHAIRVVQDPLTILAGSVEQDATSSSAGQGAPSSWMGSAQTSTATPLPPPRYQSSVDSDSSFDSSKPKQLRAPGSADELPVNATGDDTGSQFTATEMSYMLAGVELIRLLEHDPILRFIKPNAIKFTGPVRMPDFDMLTNVTRAAGTLFEMLYESGFSLGITDRTGVYDWDLESWTRTIRGVLGPLSVLVGTIQRNRNLPGAGPISAKMITSSQAESSVHSTSRSKTRRVVDGEPADLFDADFGMPKTSAATSTITSPATQKMSTRDAPKEMRQPGLGNHAVMSVPVPVTTTSKRASTTPEQSCYDARVRPVSLDPLKQLGPGQTLDVCLRSSRDAPRLWVTRSKTWVATMFKTKIERQTYLRVTNITDEAITLNAGTTVGWWTPSDVFPPAPRFVLATNWQYQDWQSLAYEVTCDEDETWLDEELVWPMYGWPTCKDLEFVARRGELEEEVHADSKPTSYPVVAVKSPTAGLTHAPAVETSSVSKLQTRGHSTLSRVVLKTRADVVTTCVRSNHGSQRSVNAGRPAEAPRVEQPVEGASGDEARRALSSGRSQRCDGERQSSERTQVEKSNRDKCDSVRRERWNVSEPSQEQSQKCDTMRRTQCNTVLQLGEGSPMRRTECDTVRQPSEGTLTRDALRLTECDTVRRSDAKSQKGDGMLPAEKGGELHRWCHLAPEIVDNKSNTVFDVVDEEPDGHWTGQSAQDAAEEGHHAINVDLLPGLKRHDDARFAIYRGNVCDASSQAARFTVAKTECHGAPPEGLLVEIPGATRRMRSGVDEPAARTTAGEVSAAVVTADPECTTSPKLLRHTSRQGRGARRAGSTDTQEGDAAGNSSQTRYAKLQRHPEEVAGEPDHGERGRCVTTTSCADAMHRAMGGADGVKLKVGVIQTTAVPNASNPSTTTMSEPLRCAADSRADTRRGTRGGDAKAARSRMVVIQPADRSGKNIGHRRLDPETASPANLTAEDCDGKKLAVGDLDAKRDAKNLDEENCDEANPVGNVPELDPPTPENMDLGRRTAHVLATMMRSASARATNPRDRPPDVLQELATQNLSSATKTPPKAAKCAESHGPGHFTGSDALNEDVSCVGSGCAVKFLGDVWVATRNTSGDSAESKHPGLCARQHSRLAQVNALEVDQDVHAAHRTRGGVATTDMAKVSLPIRSCVDGDSPGYAHVLRLISNAMAGHELRGHERKATRSSSQIRYAETLHHREEVVGKRDATRRGQCRATGSHAEARRGAMSSGLDAARTQAADNKPATTRNVSNPTRRPVAVSKYVEGPTSVRLSACYDVINRNLPCFEADWKFEVARGVSDATRDSSHGGTESTRLGICILQHRRLVLVVALKVGQAGDDADRTRSDVAATNTAGVSLLVSCCLDRGEMGSIRGLGFMLDAVARGTSLVSTYTVWLETGDTPRQVSAKKVSKLNSARAMINGTTLANKPADLRDEVPLKASRDVCAVKSDGVAYSKVRDKHAKTVGVMVDLVSSFLLARERDPRVTPMIAVGKPPHQCAEPKRRTLPIGPRTQMRCINAEPQGSPSETISSLLPLFFDVRTSKRNPVEVFPSHAAMSLAVSTNGPYLVDTCLLEHSPTRAPDENAARREKTLELHADRASRHGCACRDVAWIGYTDELDVNRGRWRCDFSRQRVSRYRLGAIYLREDTGRLSRSLVGERL